MKVYPLKKTPSDHNGMITRNVIVTEDSKLFKKKCSQNRQENLIPIILDRFPPNKPQNKMLTLDHF